MGKRPPRDFLMMNIAKTDPRQVLLAKYLRDTGKIASQLMGSADAFYYSYALGTDRSISDEKIELAASESVLALSGQIHRILNFHRIDRGIVLPNEFLVQCGLAFASSTPAVMSQERFSKVEAVLLPPVTPVVNTVMDKPFKDNLVSLSDEDEDGDEKDEEIMVGGLNVSQSVADFLNGR
jgi:hypothetical protein